MKKLASNCVYFMPIRSLVIALIFGMMFLFTTQSAVAQGKWTLTLRGGANFPTKDLGNADLNKGFGGEATIGYNFLSNLGVYPDCILVILAHTPILFRPGYTIMKLTGVFG